MSKELPGTSAHGHSACITRQAPRHKPRRAHDGLRRPEVFLRVRQVVCAARDPIIASYHMCNDDLGAHQVECAAVILS